MDPAQHPVTRPKPDTAIDPEDDPTACRFCKRPSHCPDCHKELGTPAKGPSDLDDEVKDRKKQLPKPIHEAKDTHKMFKHCVPPREPEYNEFSVFAAGSIEMGKAVQWQPLLANYLSPLPITLCNPRRGKWDSSITQLATTPDFRVQVEWELAALTKCTVIAFFFDFTTMSPVTMCELGLWAHSGKVVVCCDRRFWKGGNVHLVCERYGIPLVESFTELVPLIGAMLRVKGMVLDKEGNLAKDESQRDPNRSMSLEEAERYLEDRRLKLKGMKPDAGVMGQAER